MSAHQDKKELFLVIGSNSFTGAQFIDYLLSQEHPVIGISRSEQPHPAFLPYTKRDTSNFRFRQLDLNQDLDSIISLIKDKKPSYIVNFAAQGMVSQSWQKPEEWYQTNTLAMIKLHDRIRGFNFLKKYVQISTPEVYGSSQGFVKENINYNPSTPYAASKAAADMSLMSFYKAYDFPVVFTRAANVFGPGQQLYRIIPRTILYFMLGKKLQLHGGGKTSRSFIHINDVSKGTYKACLEGKPSSIFHLSTNETISIRALVEMIADKLGVSFDNHVELVGEQLGKDDAYLLDCTKAEKELNWAAEISLEKGIEDTLSWVSSNIEVLKEEVMDYVHKT